MRKLLIIIFFLMLNIIVFSQKREHKERYYQENFAKIINGKIEVVLDDKTRVDILTETHAIEVDFANKWAESIGQSLYYGIKTNKKPGVLLIIEDFNVDSKHLNRLKKVAIKHNISIWVINERLIWNQIKK